MKPRKPKSKKDDSDLIEEPGMGHNSLQKDVLEKTVENLEDLIHKRKDISEDITAAFAVAKGRGLDVRTIREMLKLRAMDYEKRREREMLRDTYLRALDLLD